MPKINRKFTNPKNVIESIKILKITIEVLNRYNVKYYLDFGTLIGAIRDKAFIPWDDDMDISLVNEEDYKKLPDILAEIKKSNYRTYLVTFDDSLKGRKLKGKTIYHSEINFTSENNYRVAKIRNSRFWKFGKGRNCLDIFCKYKYKNDLAWVAQGRIHSIPNDKLSNELLEIDFYGIKCSVPKNYDEYLTSMYGDWKTPKEDWQYYENDTCNFNG